METALELAAAVDFRAFEGEEYGYDTQFVIQGETLGVSMGTIMRNLATETRVRRRQHAEERAHKAPVKMLFPLVLLMFPSMFIVLLYPAIEKFSSAFGGG